MQQQIGETIRRYRNKNGYTLTQLAEKLDISTGLLSNIETGKTDSFQLTLLNNIINELHIPISELILFSKPYPVNELSIKYKKDLKKISTSLEILVNTFIETSSALSFNQNKVDLIANMLVKELHTINKLIEATKSK